MIVVSVARRTLRVGEFPYVLVKEKIDPSRRFSFRYGHSIQRPAPFSGQVGTRPVERSGGRRMELLPGVDVGSLT